MRVLVTGASGFVGRAVRSSLVQAGYSVRAAVRTVGTDASVEYAPVGDMREADWEPALRDVDAVIHLAARVHVMSDREADPLVAYRTANVVASERLAVAAVRAGVRRMIFVSSIKAMIDHASEKVIDIADAAMPTSPYGVSKLEAEHSLSRIAAETGLELVIFRPPLMYGPGVKGNFRTLMWACERGVPLPLGGLDNKRSILFVGNFADAIVRAINNRAVAGGTFLIHDEIVSVSQLVLEIGAALGRSPRLFRAPPPLLGVLRSIPFTSSAVERLTESLFVDDRPFRMAANWSPPIPLKEAMASTVKHGRTSAYGG